MLQAIFLGLMIVVFGRLAFLAVRLTWGFTKVLFTLVFLPVILFGCILLGLIKISLPLLIVIGVVSLFIR